MTQHDTAPAAAAAPRRPAEASVPHRAVAEADTTATTTVATSPEPSAPEPPPAPVAPPPSSPPPPPPATTGTIGECTVTLTRALYWRSAILAGPRGRSPDGFGPMNVSISARIECAVDTELSVDRAWVMVGSDPGPRRHPLRPEGGATSVWSGLVSAGAATDATFTWHDGPFAPRGAAAHAVVRLRVRRQPPLELEAPARPVGFVS